MALIWISFGLSNGGRVVSDNSFAVEYGSKFCRVLCVSMRKRVVQA